MYYRDGKKYLIGIEELDRGHKEFFDSLAKILDASLTRDLNRILMDLVLPSNLIFKKLRSEFRLEEEIMERIGHGDKESHKKEHLKIEYDFEKELFIAHRDESYNFLIFKMGALISSHILEWDKKLAIPPPQNLDRETEKEIQGKGKLEITEHRFLVSTSNPDVDKIASKEKRFCDFSCACNTCKIADIVSCRQHFNIHFGKIDGFLERSNAFLENSRARVEKNNDLIFSTAERIKQLKGEWWDSYSIPISEVEKLNSTMNESSSGLMFADQGLVLRHINPIAMSIFEPLEPYLPARVGCLPGLSIDRLVRKPDVIRKITGDPRNLPYHTQIIIGPKTLDLKVRSARTDDNKYYLGVIAHWTDITESQTH